MFKKVKFLIKILLLASYYFLLFSKFTISAKREKIMYGIST